MEHQEYLVNALRDLISLELFEAVEKGDLAKVKTLIEEGRADINARKVIEGVENRHLYNGNEVSILHLAAINGHKNIVDYLIVECGFPYFKTEMMSIGVGHPVEIITDIEPYIGQISATVPTVVDIVGQGNSREIKQKAADVIFMRAISQRYSRMLNGMTVARKEGNRAYINEMLRLITVAIGMIERCKNEVDYIPQKPDRPQIDYKLEFQKQVLTWISVCAKSVLVNYPQNRDISVDMQGIPIREIAFLGYLTDLLLSNRGQQYGSYIFDTADSELINAVMGNIVEELPGLALIINDHLNPTHPIRDITRPTTFISSLSRYYSDISILERIKYYTKIIINPNFDFRDPSGKESALRCIEAIGECFLGLSEDVKKMFAKVNIEAFVSIRNYLDHINGDCNNHRAGSKESRAERMQKLIFEHSPDAEEILRNIVQTDISHIDAVAASTLNVYKRDMQQILQPKELRRLPETVPQSFSRYVGEFETFLSLEEYKPVVGVISELSAISTTQTTAWQIEAKKILQIEELDKKQKEKAETKVKERWDTRIIEESDLGRRERNRLIDAIRKEEMQILAEESKAREIRLKLLMPKVRIIDENFKFLQKSLLRIEKLQEEIDCIFKRDIASLPFTSRIEQRRQAIEYNLIDFSEHLCGLCESEVFKDFYKRRFGSDIKKFQEGYVEKIRNYFSHVGKYKFHNPEGIDHAKFYTQIIPLMKEEMKKIEAVKIDIDNEIQPLLEESPSFIRERATLHSR